MYNRVRNNNNTNNNNNNSSDNFLILFYYFNSIDYKLFINVMFHFLLRPLFAVLASYLDEVNSPVRKNKNKKKKS